ncbi:hypothetical protein ON003_08500 [Janibacter hoylei]|nr:hypothetical protein [Janibacter hoylei]
MAGVVDDEGQVEQPVAHRVGRLLGGELARVHPDAGVLDGEGGQGAGQQARGHRRPHPDAQPGGDARLGLLDRGRRALDRAEDLLGVVGQEQAELGELDPPAVALDELDPDLALELGELLGDARRAVVQGLRGSGHRAAPVQLAQHLQASQGQLHPPTVGRGPLLGREARDRAGRVHDHVHLL